MVPSQTATAAIGRRTVPATHCWCRSPSYTPRCSVRPCASDGTGVASVEPARVRRAGLTKTTTTSSSPSRSTSPSTASTTVTPRVATRSGSGVRRGSGVTGSATLRQPSGPATRLTAGSTAVTGSPGSPGVGEAALDPEWVALGTAAGAEVVGALASLAAVTATTCLLYQ